MIQDNWPVMAMFKRDSLLAFRQVGDWALPTSFYALVIVLFPLGLGLDTQMLQNLAPGLFWVIALLAALMSVPQLFRTDWENGTVDQWVVSGVPLWLAAGIRVVVAWCFSAVPMLLLTPLLGLGYGLTWGATLWLVISIAVGSPTLAWLGGLGASLTLGVRNGSLLVMLLVLPLCTPVLIFGAGTVQSFSSGLPVDGPLSMLLALSLLTSVLIPPAMGVALRMAVE